MVLKKEGPNLSVELGPLKLKNPVIAASGTFGYGTEYARMVDVQRLGDLVGRLSREEQWGVDAALLTVLGLD